VVVDPLVFFVDLTAAAVAVAGVDWIVVEGIFWLFPETSTLFCLSATILIPAEFVGFLPFFDGDTLSAGTDDAQVT
jgi:putative transposon-encoded protein